MRMKDQTSSNAYIQVQSNLKFKLRFNGKRSFIKETFAIVAFLLFFDSVRVINYVSFYHFRLIMIEISNVVFADKSKKLQYKNKLMISYELNYSS